MPRTRSIPDGHELAMALRTAYLRMHRRADAHFAEGGVTADQFVLLGALAEMGPTTQRQLADRIACDENTLRAMLVLLERRALVVRVAHPTDGRARLVSLTTEGAALHQFLWRRNLDFRQSLVGALGTEEAAELIALLRRFSDSLSIKETRP